MKITLKIITIIFSLQFLHAQTPGTKKWAFETGGFVHSSPAISVDGTVFVGAGYYSTGKLFAVNPDGTQKWAFETGSDIKSSPAIGADGTIYVGSNDFKLYAINLNGTQKWAFETNSRVKSSPAIGADGTVYVGSYDNKLYAISSNGIKKWELLTGGHIYSSPAIGSDGTVYVGSYDNKLYAINPDGTKKWDFQTGNGVKSSPAIGSDGTVYVGSEDNKVYAIYGDGTGLANSAWPKFSHDNQNTGNYLYVTSIEQQNTNEYPKEFALYPLYPNPFNPSTKIKFNLPKAVKVEIEVYNVAGQFIGKLLNEKRKSGIYIVTWDASNMATGMYFIRMKSENYVKIRKCLLIK